MVRFGTDGIRGRAGRDVTASLAMALGAAVVRELGGRVAIAVDGRPSGPMLEHAVVAGVSGAGGSAVRMGRLPTPALSLLVANEGFDAGVMITASHNPPLDNGLKVFDRGGHKPGRAVRERLEAGIAAGVPPAGWPGTVSTHPGPGAAYLVRLRALLHEVLGEDAGIGRQPLRDRRVVVDAANGAGGEVALALLQGLGARVERVDAGDGAAINEGCGATHPEFLARAVHEAGADVGVALDGDGDRVVLVDGRGRLYDGDALLWIHARALPPGAPPVVVGTVMTNQGLEEALRQRGMRLVRTAVGDAEVAAGMAATGARIGGEPSGHLLYAPGPPTADGLYAAVVAMLPDPRTLPERVAGYRPHVQAHRTVRLGANQLPTIPADLVSAVEAGGARVVIRPSGTEPVVRILVEHPDRAHASAGADRLFAALSATL